MTAPLTKNEIDSFSDLTDEIYTYAKENIKPDGNWIRRLFSSNTTYDLSNLFPGVSLSYYNNRFTDVKTIKIQTDKVAIRFEDWIIRNLSVWVINDNEYVPVNKEEGPWHDQVRSILKQLRANYCQAIEIPVDHASKRGNQLERARDLFAQPKNARRDNPLLKS